MNRATDSSKPPALKPETLAHLRDIVEEMALSSRGVPHAQVMELARTPGLAAGITIDFQAAHILGSPLVILRMAAPTGTKERLSMLSPRERSVAALIAEGLSNKEIAGRLALSLATVKDHVHRILVKTEMPNRAAVAAAYSNDADSR